MIRPSSHTNDKILERERNKKYLAKKYSQWYRANKEYVREYKRKYRLKCKEQERNRALKYRFGINLTEYNKMHAKQRGKCAICRKPETSKHYSGTVRCLSVDHNHTTGEVRQLLCNRCNKVIGHCNESIVLLRKMIKYLVKHNDSSFEVDYVKN